MLIDFTVENYRSIKEPVTLSAIAQRQRASQGNREGIKTDAEIAPPYVVEKRGIGLLPVLAIFGANASGKSNVVTALDNLLTFIISGPGANRQFIRRFIPFKLDKLTIKAPIRFQMRVLVEKTVYIYSLALSQGRIIYEQLEYLPLRSRLTRLLYRAEWDETQHSYQWNNGPDFVGPHKKLEPSWLGLDPFIRVFMTQFASPPLKAFIDWLQGYWFGVSLGSDAINDLDLAATLSEDFPGLHTSVVQLIQRFDTGLSDIRLEWSKSDAFTAEVDEMEQDFDMIAVHEASGGSVEWSFGEESGGTRSLYPLAYKLLAALKFSGCILVDELGANMHPNITHEIVRMFQSPVTNPNRAQLIVTTHDATMQSGQLLRRDQIWFTEKRSDSSTNLYPLTDFKERNDRNIYRSYIDGRYGAVPVLPPLETLVPEEVGR